MKIKSYNEILKEIEREYNSSPRRWSVSIVRDGTFFDIYALRGDTGWKIKLDTIFRPDPVGVGTRIQVEKSIEHPFSYGLRPLSEENFRKIIAGEHNIFEVLKADPLPAHEIDTSGILKGPVHFLNDPIREKSSRKVDRRLREKLMEKLHREGVTNSYL
jgi:hypothetical protein